MSLSTQTFPMLFGAAQASHVNVSVGTTSTQILPALNRANGKRYRVRLENHGTNPVAIRVGGVATFGTGGEIILAGGSAANDGKGGFIELDGCQANITGITGTGTSNVGVFSISA